MATDKTTTAVMAQLDAMGCEFFTVGIHSQEKGQMMNRNFSYDEVIKSIPFLKRMNVTGNNIYVKPDSQKEQHSLILIDDIKPDALADLEKKGLPPVLFLQTSPNNCQAWVKMKDKAIEPNVRTHIAKAIATDYGADSNSADFDHYGRLAGFTNQKPKYMTNGKFPFVQLSKATKAVAEPTVSAAYETKARVRLNEEYELTQKAIEKTKKEVEEISKFEVSGKGEGALIQNKSNPDDFFNAMAQTIKDKYKSNLDVSAMDFRIVTAMLVKGFPDASIKGAVVRNSPDLIERKGTHAINEGGRDYVDLTLLAAKKKLTEAGIAVHQKTEHGMWR
jgi:hypothetical protein